MSRTRRITLLPLLALSAIAFGGCAENYPQSVLAPASDFTWQLQRLFEWIVFWAVVVGVVVFSALIYVMIRYRRRPGDAIPPQIHGHTTLEIIWTIIPFVIVVLIAVPTVEVIFATAEIPRDATTNITVVGKQWWWEYRYREAGIVTANEMHVPVGETIGLHLQSADVIHAFWIPRLAAKRDVIPGRNNTLWFKAESPGEYIGQCAEFCGTSHANMHVRVIVHTRADYDAWVRSQKAPAAAPTTPQQQRGFQIVTTGACAGCHTVDGTPAQGKVGPNLTHFGQRETLTALKTPSTPENLKAWLRDPPRFKDGALMPNLGLGDEELDALVAYLKSLR